MSFGKYQPKDSTLNTHSGYAGLFWGHIYDSKGNEIKNAEEHFMPFEYWDIIDDAIGEHCNKYLGPLIKNNLIYSYQYGFGGDNCNGLIDFWLPVQVSEMPDLKFKIKDEEYTLKWECSEEE